ncbi:MAG: hypothetical protein PHU92_00685 [Candidatus Shapirobacteria bacterium]|nr:hypothetical protein [Candidatus Shapirobacteria bacterium]
MDNDLPQRKSIHLKDYDYSSSGWYYLTICTQDRQGLLGKIINGKMKLNEFGKITKGKIKGLEKYQNINVDIYCVMPNHIHLIINIVGAEPRVRPSSMDFLD